MSYTLRQIIPSKPNIVVKECIPSLTGIVIEHKYYLSLEDYNSLNITINSLIDVLNFIKQKSSYNYYNFDSIDDLNKSISSVVTSQFVYVDTVNDKKVVSDPSLQNITTLKQFKINGIYYKQSTHGNDIQVSGHFISGKPEDYVQSFNGQTGDVTGLSTLAITINRIRQRKSPVYGVITLTGLTRKKNYVSQINESNQQFVDVKYLLSTITINEHEFIPAGNGHVYLNNYVITGANTTPKNLVNSLVGSVGQPLSLANVDDQSDYSAVNVDYLNNGNNNKFIICGNIVNNTFDLAASYYPLHFYDINGNLLNDIKWKITSNINDIKTISSSIESAIYTAMKVREVQDV